MFVVGEVCVGGGVFGGVLWFGCGVKLLPGDVKSEKTSRRTRSLATNRYCFADGLSLLQKLTEKRNRGKV